MSLLPSLNAASVEGGVYDYYFALKDESAKNWSKFKAVSDASMDNHGITGVTYLDIDGQVLTADPTNLLLNGTPIATITGITGVEQWSLFPSLSSLNLNASGVPGHPFGVSGSAYYGYYQGSTLGITGTVGSSTLLLDGQAIGGTGYTGSAKYWSQNVALGSVNMGGNNISNALTITGTNVNANTSMSSPNATFTNATITNLNVSGITGITGVSQWSTIPAVSNVVMNGNNITSGAGNGMLVNASRDLTLNSNSGIVTVNTGVTGIFKQDFDVNSGRTNIVADLGATLGFDSAINLTSQNGTRGNITLDAKPGSGSLGGVVNITAEGGELDGYSYGGLINLNATTPTLTGLSSAIKLSASGIDSYAGATPIGSVLGYNFVYGRLGVNLTASVTLPATNIPGTVYLYGDNGVVSGASLYVYNQITNYYNGASNPLPLNVTGRTVAGTDYPVNLDKVGSIGFSSQQSGQINGCKQFSGNSATMSGINSLTSSSVSANTLNSATGTLAISQVGSISGNSGSFISGFTGASVTSITTSQVNGNSGAGLTGFTNVSSVNGYFTNINSVSASNVVAPCKTLSGTFGVVNLTTAPIVVFETSSLTWNWNNISKLGASVSISVGIDRKGSYAFACQILYNSTTYNFNTFTLTAPYISQDGQYNGVNIVSATLSDSFDNVIPNGSAYRILVYMWCGSTSTAVTTGGVASVNLISGQSL